MRLVPESEYELGTDLPSTVMAEMARRDLQRLFQRHLASWASDALAASRSSVGSVDVVEFDQEWRRAA